MNFKHLTTSILGCLLALSLSAQLTPLRDGSYQATLSSGDEIIVFPQERNEVGKIPCYYLPTNLRLSMRDSSAEFSLMTFGEDGEVSGGLMHWLLKWGLESSQKKELQSILQNSLDPNAAVFGALTVDPPSKGPDFEISSSCTLGQLLNNSLTRRSPAPLNPGGKLAASHMLSAEDAKSLSAAIKDPVQLKRVEVVMHFTCRVVLRGDVYHKDIDLRRNLLDLLQPWLEEQD
jgi:hypothetical protein